MLLPDGRVVGVFHHAGGLGSGVKTLWCFDTDGNACPGYPRETLDDPQESWSTGVGYRFYYRALNAAGAPAIVCWDFTTDYLCQPTGIISGTKYTPVAQSTATRDFSGPRALGGKLWTVWGNGRVDCIEPATNTQCAGYTANTVTNTLPGTWDGTSPDADFIPYNGKLYMLTGMSGSTGKRTYCWDPALNGGTGGQCVGFNSVGPNTGTDLILRPDISKTIIGFCAIDAAGPGRCWDFNGQMTQTLTFPANLTDEPDSRRIMGDLTYGSRTFFATSTGVEGYDWKTSARCVGFPIATGLSPYGLGRTTSPVCLVSANHNQPTATSFDPRTGGGCAGNADDGLDIDAATFYCGDPLPADFAWNQVKLYNANFLTPTGQFTSFKVTVVNSDTGALLIGPVELIGSGLATVTTSATGATLSLAGISTSITHLKAVFTYTAKTLAIFTGTNRVAASILYTSTSPAEFCFQTSYTCDPATG